MTEAAAATTNAISAGQFSCWKPQEKCTTTLVALTAIIALGSVLVGVFATFNIAGFSAIGAAGTQALLYGGAALLGLSIIATAIRCCRQSSAQSGAQSGENRISLFLAEARKYAEETTDPEQQKLCFAFLAITTGKSLPSQREAALVEFKTLVEDLYNETPSKEGKNWLKGHLAELQAECGQFAEARATVAAQFEENTKERISRELEIAMLEANTDLESAKKHVKELFSQVEEYAEEGHLCDIFKNVSYTNPEFTKLIVELIRTQESEYIQPEEKIQALLVIIQNSERDPILDQFFQSQIDGYVAAEVNSIDACIALLDVQMEIDPTKEKALHRDLKTVISPRDHATLEESEYERHSCGRFELALAKFYARTDLLPEAKEHLQSALTAFQEDEYPDFDVLSEIVKLELKIMPEDGWKALPHAKEARITENIIEAEIAHYLEKGAFAKAKQVLEEAEDLRPDQRPKLKLDIAFAEENLAAVHEMLNQEENEDPGEKCMTFLMPAAKKAGVDLV